MKNAFLILLIGLAAYGGFSIWNDHREKPSPPKIVEAKSDANIPLPLTIEATPAPVPEPAKIEPEKPQADPEPVIPIAPMAPQKRLAPAGVFYAVQAFSVTTDDGVRGIRAGTPVKLIKDGGDTLRVTDGKDEFDAKREHLTDDLDLAAHATGQQANQQAVIAQWHDKQQTKADALEQQKSTEALVGTEIARKTMAIQNLRNRDAALAAEYARAKQTVAEIERDASHVSRSRGGTTITSSSTRVRDEIPQLRSRLSAISSERMRIAKELRILQH